MALNRDERRSIGAQANGIADSIFTMVEAGIGTWPTPEAKQKAEGAKAEIDRLLMAFALKATGTPRR